MSHHVPGPLDYDVVMTEQVSGPKEPKLLGRHMPSIPNTHNFLENLFKINESNIQLCCNLGVSKRSFNKSQGDNQILGFPGPKSPV